MRSGKAYLILMIYFDNGWIPGRTRAKKCGPGFYLDSKRKCIDDNECGDNEYTSSARCGSNTDCYNTQASYYCTCKKGFFNQLGKTNFTSRMNCHDIDECVTDPCGLHTTCTNTFGNFYCTCNEGFTRERTFTNKAKTQCQELNRNNMNRCSLNKLTGQMSHIAFRTFCSEINSIIKLTDEQWQKQSGALPWQEIISNSSDLLGNDSLWDGMEREQQLLSAFIFLQTMEHSAIAAGLSLPDQGKRTISSENIDLEVRTFRGKNSSAQDRVSLWAKGNVMDIYRQTVTERKTTGTDFAAVALIAYKNMDSILNGSVFKLSTTGGKLKPFQLISNIVSAMITNRDSHGLKRTVNFTFKHTEKAISNWTMYCVRWNYAAGKSYWSPSGCSMGDSNGTDTQCRCNHLSSLALLMSPVEWPVYHHAVDIISFIGIPVSLVCLGIAIVTFAFCSSLKTALHATHKQLCLSLFLAELLFLAGIGRTRNRVVCGIIAGFLHYFFLAAFLWMFFEGVQLCHMIKNIRNLGVSHSEKIGKVMYPIGYGVPAVIVIISVAVRPDGYGTPEYCWLSAEEGLKWSFLGPVCLIIVINTVLFFTILWMLKREISKRDTQISKLQDTRMMTFKAIAQVFILGCTWIFGLLQIPGDPGVMLYIFTIFNSFQGTFIFILLCVLNPKVRAEYRKWFARMRKANYTMASQDNNVNTMTTVSSSHQ
ncbi:adhesion G protein-coupled receptor E2-like [Carcharodon carcharias]|uniref:adhesion G protein-coupled receptor E2-like n=1 Tax=Carcharodon carcharias TaxID=13397 RepID=UPI001B7EC85B|nr:adhesion G protein-coupled receptor E2-like [Carcharodon carcharias]